MEAPPQQDPWVARLVGVFDRADPCKHTPVERLDDVDEVVIGRARSSTSLRRNAVLELGLPDGRVSASHARLRRELDHWVLEDMGSRNGTWVGATSVARHVLSPGEIVEVGRHFFLFDFGPSGTTRAQTPAQTYDPMLAARLEALSRVAKTGLAITIYGEVGTGREKLARSVHRTSNRRGAFVAIDCSALDRARFEEALLGEEGGAPGFVEQAHRGTLFLEGVADLPNLAQKLLADVLRERKVLPVGGVRPRSVDFRLVTTTLGDLRSRVQAQRFRPELLRCIRGFELRLPSLRERRCDFGLLVAELLQSFGRPDATFDRAAARLMLHYAWPLNIRELKHTLRRALEIAKGDPITLACLPRHLVRVTDSLPVHAADTAASIA